MAADIKTYDGVFGDGMVEAFRQMENIARETIDLIKAGDTDEAILRLEREFWPKWESVNNSMYDLLAHQSA